MENTGWKDLGEVWIPPIEREGFKEDVVIRKPIAPAPVKMAAEPVQTAPAPAMAAEAEMMPEVMPEPYQGEESTVLLAASDDSGEERPTVLLTEEIMFSAWLKRTGSGEKIRVDKEEFIIGKSGAADYVIRDNATVSRRHAVIRKLEDGYYLEDLGSANHTFVDGVMITEPVKLVNGSAVRLSEEEFIFMLV